MSDNMTERMKLALRPFLHHGLNAYPNVEAEAVRAVLAAMLEPTEQMVEFAFHNGQVGVAHIWKAMVEAALAEES